MWSEFRERGYSEKKYIYYLKVRAAYKIIYVID